METLTALAPILVVLALLMLRVPALWAATAGLGVALGAAALAFPVTRAEAGVAATQMAPTVVEVALILLGGVTLAEAMARGGAQDRIAAWLAELERLGGRTPMLLLLVYGLTCFMESVTGFGLGVVITAPLMIRLGLSPARAVVVGLLGLVLVPWGSLAPGLLISAELGGVGFSDLGFWTALLSLPVLLISAAAVLFVAFRRPSVRQIVLAAAVVGWQWAVLVGFSAVLEPPLAGVVSSGAVMAALMVAMRMRGGSLPRVTPAIRRALVPYAVLVSGILAGTAVAAAAGQPALVALSSPGAWAVVAGAVAVVTSRSVAGSVHSTVVAAVRRWLPIATTTIVFMLIGTVMAATGMAARLAADVAASGPYAIAAVPIAGALGGFLTGSNTGAAAMFSSTSAAAATGLGANPLIALAGQNAAGAFAMVASPPRIALAVGVAFEPGGRLPARWVRLLVLTICVAAAVQSLLALVLT